MSLWGSLEICDCDQKFLQILHPNSFDSTPDLQAQETHQGVSYKNAFKTSWIVEKMQEKYLRNNDN